MTDTWLTIAMERSFRSCRLLFLLAHLIFQANKSYRRWKQTFSSLLLFIIHHHNSPNWFHTQKIANRVTQHPHKGVAFERRLYCWILLVGGKLERKRRQFFMTFPYHNNNNNGCQINRFFLNCGRFLTLKRTRLSRHTPLSTLSHTV